MARNFYNLPPPWDPGYADPQSVLDEGLQRHAFVTKMMPRGTYDSSTDGSAGYAIPQYVLEEGTGRGTITSAWTPRGYYGPKIPNYLNRQPRPNIVLGDITEYGSILAGHQVPPTPPVKNVRTSFHAFGQRAAKTVLSHVARVHPAQRAHQLKAILDRIDPSLHARTMSGTQAAVRAGVPARKALEVGLSNAMTSGILGELHQIGTTRRMPQPRSLLGLGLYQALGATGFGKGGGLPTPTPKPPTPPKSPTGAPCGNPPPGLTWNATATPSWAGWPGNPLPSGAWQVVNGNATPRPYPIDGNYCGTTPTNLRCYNAQGREYACPWNPPFVVVNNYGTPKQEMQVGPFTVDADPTHVPVINFNRPELPSEWQSLIRNGLTNDALQHFKDQFNVLGLAPAPANPWWQVLGIDPGTIVAMKSVAPKAKQGNWSDSDSKAAPVMKFKHPVSGSMWGVFVSMLPNPSAPTQMQIYFKWLPDKPWYDSILDSITEIIVKVVKGVEAGVKAAADAVGDLACQALRTPGAAQGAAIASGGAAGVGVVAAAGLCGGAAPVMPLLPPQPSLMMPLLIGGGALVALSFITKKKKKPAGAKP